MFLVGTVNFTREREREREHDSPSGEETLQQSSLKFPARTLAAISCALRRRPARLFNHYANNEPITASSPVCADHAPLFTASRLRESEREGGGKVGAESQWSGKGWRPKHLIQRLDTLRRDPQRHGPLPQSAGLLLQLMIVTFLCGGLATRAPGWCEV